MGLLFWSKDRPPNVREFFLLVLRGLVAGSATGVLLSFGSKLLFNRHPGHTFDNWPEVLLYSVLVGAIFWTSYLVFCGLPWGYLRPLLRDYPPRVRGAIVALVGALGAMVAFSVSVGIFSLIPNLHFMGIEHFHQILAIEAIIGATLALVIGSFKALQGQIRTAEAALHEKETRERALSEAAARAQALALQSQINPHFFFNTLNTLSALIPINPESAQEMIGRLADMFRYTLACSRAEQVTLTQELAFIENYLCLEKARFSDRLRVRLPQGEFSDIHLPGLSLQPLIENAIRHGISKRIEGGEVQVSVHRNGVQCEVEVVNPVEASAKTADFFQEGHALAIVRERLALQSGSVRVATGKPGSVCVSLLVPLGTKA